MQTKFGDYQYFFDIKEDEEWKNYHSFLYPNPYEFQGIKNREVTFQLDDHEEFKYSLNIAKENITVLSEVNDYVWDLMELAKDNNGVYGGWGCPVVN